MGKPLVRETFKADVWFVETGLNHGRGGRARVIHGKGEIGKLIQKEILTSRSGGQNRGQKSEIKGNLNWVRSRQLGETRKQARGREHEIRHELRENPGHLLTQSVR